MAGRAALHVIVKAVCLVTACAPGVYAYVELSRQSGCGILEADGTFTPFLESIPAEWEEVLPRGASSAQGTLVLPATGNQEGCSDHDDSIAGHVLLVERGSCFFGQKARKGMNSGAVAVIIVNNQANSNPRIGMLGNPDPDSPPIPTFMVLQDEGAELQDRVQQGESIEVSCQWSPLETWFDAPEDGPTNDTVLTITNPGTETLAWSMTTMVWHVDANEQVYTVSSSSGVTALTTDPSGSWTTYTTPSSVITLTLPFSFKFFFRAISTLSAYPNGMIVVTGGEDPNDDPSTLPNGGIAPLWAVGGGVLSCDACSISAASVEDEVFIVRYENLMVGNSFTVSYDIRIFPDGQISWVYYGTPADADSLQLLYTLESGVADLTGTTIDATTTLTPEVVTVTVMPWLRTTSLFSGSLQPGESHDFEFILEPSPTLKAWLYLQYQDSSARTWRTSTRITQKYFRNFAELGPWDGGLLWGVCFDDAENIKRRGANCTDNTETGAMYSYDVCRGTCRDVDQDWRDIYENTCKVYLDMSFCTSSGALGASWGATWGSPADYVGDGQLDALDNCCVCGGGVEVVTVEELLTEPCDAVACPSNSVGENLQDGCVCESGHGGHIIAQETEVAPYYMGSCELVLCPGNSIGDSVLDGCTCTAGFELLGGVPIQLSSESPYYTGECVAFTSTSSSSSTSFTSTTTTLTSSSIVTSSSATSLSTSSRTSSSTPFSSTTVSLPSSAASDISSPSTTSATSTSDSDMQGITSTQLDAIVSTSSSTVSTLSTASTHTSASTSSTMSRINGSCCASRSGSTSSTRRVTSSTTSSRSTMSSGSMPTSSTTQSERSTTRSTGSSSSSHGFLGSSTTPAGMPHPSTSRSSSTTSVDTSDTSSASSTLVTTECCGSSTMMLPTASSTQAQGPLQHGSTSTSKATSGSTVPGAEDEASSTTSNMNESVDEENTTDGNGSDDGQDSEEGADDTTLILVLVALVISLLLVLAILLGICRKRWRHGSGSGSRSRQSRWQRCWRSVRKCSSKAKRRICGRSQSKVKKYVEDYADVSGCDVEKPPRNNSNDFLDIASGEELLSRRTSAASKQSETTGSGGNEPCEDTDPSTPVDGLASDPRGLEQKELDLAHDLVTHADAKNDPIEVHKEVDSKKEGEDAEWLEDESTPPALLADQPADGVCCLQGDRSEEEKHPDAPPHVQRPPAQQVSTQVDLTDSLLDDLTAVAQQQEPMLAVPSVHQSIHPDSSLQVMHEAQSRLPSQPPRDDSARQSCEGPTVLGSMSPDMGPVVNEERDGAGGCETGSPPGSEPPGAVPQSPDSGPEGCWVKPVRKLAPEQAAIFNNWPDSASLQGEAADDRSIATPAGPRKAQRPTSAMPRASSVRHNESMPAGGMGAWEDSDRPPADSPAPSASIGSPQRPMSAKRRPQRVGDARPEPVAVGGLVTREEEEPPMHGLLSGQKASRQPEDEDALDGAVREGVLSRGTSGAKLQASELAAAVISQEMRPRLPKQLVPLDAAPLPVFRARSKEESRAGSKETDMARSQSKRQLDKNRLRQSGRDMVNDQLPDLT